MLRKVIATVAILALLLIGFAAFTAKREPALTARVVELTTIDEKWFGVGVLVSNRTGHVYAQLIGHLEVWDGTHWIFCPDRPGAESQVNSLGPHRASTTHYTFRRFAPGMRMRLVIWADRSRTHLEDSLYRLRLRLFGGPPEGLAVSDEFAAR